MRNHSSKRFRGATTLTTENRSRMFIEQPKDGNNRQCPSCKHKFSVDDKKKHTCPECGNTNTRTIA